MDDQICWKFGLVVHLPSHHNFFFQTCLIPTEIKFDAIFEKIDVVNKAGFKYMKLPGTVCHYG